MENEVKRDVLFNRPGGTASKNSIMARITLPPDYVKALGITPDDKGVILRLEGETIVIRKSPRVE